MLCGGKRRSVTGLRETPPPVRAAGTGGTTVQIESAFSIFHWLESTESWC